MCTEIQTNESFTANRHPFLKRERKNELDVLLKCNVQNLLNKDYLLICKMPALSQVFYEDNVVGLYLVHLFISQPDHSNSP